jgi:hypothetical protein
MSPLAAALLALALVSTACGPSGGGTAHSTEVAKVRSGTLDVVLLSQQAALGQGKSTATIEFRSTSDGSLVDVGTVKATATMSMAGMAPMSGDVSVEPTSTAGRYLATSNLGMAGQWRMAVEWSGAAGSGSANFSPMVQ